MDYFHSNPCPLRLEKIVELSNNKESNYDFLLTSVELIGTMTMALAPSAIACSILASCMEASKSLQG